MKLENIIKNLKKDGYKVTSMQFCFRECQGVNGTALADIVEENILDTSAKYKDVIAQIEAGKSHIYTISDKKKILTEYQKLG